MNIKKELFKIFQNKKENYDLYEEVTKFCEKLEFETKVSENERFYSELNKLINSINNAGWENRHQKQIDYIWELQEVITNKYGDSSW